MISSKINENCLWVKVGQKSTSKVIHNGNDPDGAPMKGASGAGFRQVLPVPHRVVPGRTTALAWARHGPQFRTPLLWSTRMGSQNAHGSFRSGTLLRMLRVQQWIKNAFVFFPAFFGEAITREAVLERTVLGFFCFSLAASAVYLLNDLRDMEQDRLHPVKRLRPIASGEVDPAHVPWISGLLALAALWGAWLVEPRFAWVLAAYMAMNVLYSLWLKHVPIVDVAIIAAGFLLRVHAGGILARVPVSEWIELITFLLALFLALAKRRDDLVQSGGGKELRPSLRGYNLPFVDASMITLAALVVQSYIMYTVSSEVTGRLGSDKVYITSGFVVLGMMRYFQLTLVEQRTGDPSKLVFKDRPIRLIILGWLLTFAIILYAI